MTDPFDADPVARELRASLERHAREAPRGDMLAERIVQQADRASIRRDRPGWKTWTLPLIAAAAVAGVVAAVIGIQGYSSVGKGSTVGAPLPQPTGSATQVPFTPHVGPGPAPATESSRKETDKLHAVKLLDLTFVSESEGWALGSAQCIQGAGRCTALFHTKGEHWWSLPNSTPFNVAGIREGCATRCVTNIRFANPKVGYVYGPSAFLMTTDGGKHWAEQPGGAVALESLDGNVIRVTSTGGGCPSWCNVAVETAPIGSTTWTPAAGIVGAQTFGVQLSRGGSDAYLLSFGHPAGGAPDGKSVLFRSSDDGRTWAPSGEPCPQTNGEVDSYAVAAAPEGRVAVLCANRQAPQQWFVATSTDDGAHFTAEPGGVPALTANLLTGDPSTTLVTADNGMTRSTDGGKSWHHVASVTGGIEFVGFESDTVGRAVSADGNTIWTTRDAGKTWQPATFG
jgi:photosystem II stability/assembly factor-like uncharacterized protein